MNRAERGAQAQMCMWRTRFMVKTALQVMMLAQLLSMCETHNIGHKNQFQFMIGLNVEGKYYSTFRRLYRKLSPSRDWKDFLSH